MSLLITKLYFPPARPALVHRPRLVERLSIGLRGPLTLVAAPAGYGKTSLFSEWRADVGSANKVAWYSLDESDNDWVRFMLYLLAAIEAIQPKSTFNTSLLLKSTQPPAVEVICTALLNEIAALAGDLILVLDDYHVITAKKIHDTLTFLLDHLPPHIHLAILTRSDPPLPLSRLRARNHMTEIRAHDLRFQPDEAAEFLNQIMRLNLTTEEVAALETRTEGWIAGLQLAALSMQGLHNTEKFIASFSGGHQYIVDYLVEEVLSRQPEPVRDFLLKTCILERITGPLCDALTGSAHGHATLEMLARSNLFLIALDDERRWFRYHHLFADLLRNRLRNSAPESIPELHLRAAGWFESQQMVIEAIEHAFNAQAYSDVLRLMRKFFPVWWGAENWGWALKWFDKFPLAFLHAEPWLCVMYAWMVWGRGKLEQTEALLDCAQTALNDLHASGIFPVGDVEYEGLQAEIMAFQALITTQKNNPQKVIELANKALEIAPEGATTVKAVAYGALQAIYRELGQMDRTIEICLLGLPHAKAGGQTGTIATTYHLLGGALTIQGQLTRSAGVYEEALEYAHSISAAHTPAFGLIRLRLADLYYQWNQLDQAESHINEGLIHADFGANYWSMVYGRYLRCQVCAARGDQDALQKAWDEIEALKPKIAGAYYQDELNRLLQLAKARFGIEDGSIIPGIRTPFPSDQDMTSTQFEHWLYQAHFLVAQKKYSQAFQVLQDLERIASQRGHLYWLIEILVLQAVLWQQKHDQKKALQNLEHAIRLAEPEGFIRLFLNEGKPIRELLQVLHSGPKDAFWASYVQKLLEAFSISGSIYQPAVISSSDLLSKRELEVLGLIAAGHSNKEIARELVIAIGTVKRHTVNIFNKLDAKNRTEAVAKARELQLLDKTFR